jgi:hemolysin III
MANGYDKQSLIYEEIANSITIALGLLLSLPGLVGLIIIASLNGNSWHVISCSIYGATLVLSYSAFTLYHTFRSKHVKHIFKILDHSAIYLLIAGTYTPFTLVLLRGNWGWTLFGLVWGLSIIGIIFKIFFVGRFKLVSTISYIFMGWLIVIASKPLFYLIPKGGIGWLVAGGLFYTTGILFYAFKKIPFNHAIWHLFVLAGSICHYFAVIFYVIPISIEIRLYALISIFE